MDERWMRALRAKGINVDGQAGEPTDNRRRAALDANAGQSGKSGNALRRSQSFSAARTKPFKATGHKGGISRQGN